ncbi:MAG: hypothetical protein R3E48_21620 [Burkholderiaceae bacterium]
MFASAFPVRQSQVKSVVFENTAADDDCVPEKQDRPQDQRTCTGREVIGQARRAGSRSPPTRPANFSHQLDNEKQCACARQ